MLLISRKNKKEEIKRLYNSVFTGEEDFASRFFDSVWREEYCLSASFDGRLVSAVNILPCSLTDGESRFSAGYVYAAMTDKEYRKRGLMAELLKKSFELGNDFSILIVQTDSLFNYYSRFGYLPLCTVAEEKFKAEKSDFKIRKAKESEYKILAEIYRQSTVGCLKNERTADEFARISLVYNLPFWVSADEKEISSYCIGFKEGDIFTAAEAMGGQGKNIAQALAAAQECVKIICRAPGTDKPIGMIKPLSERAAEYLKDKRRRIYINLLYN